MTLQRAPLLMRVEGDVSEEEICPSGAPLLSGLINADTGERGSTQHLFFAWEPDAAHSVAADYRDDGEPWVLVVQGAFSAPLQPLEGLGCGLLIASSIASSEPVNTGVICSEFMDHMDFGLVAGADQISVEREVGTTLTLRLEHADGISDLIEVLRR